MERKVSHFVYNLVYSGGFDCCLKESDLNLSKVKNSCNINDALAAILGLRLVTPAHIYHIAVDDDMVLMSLETGHLLCFNQTEEDDLAFDFLIDAHANKIIQT